MDFLKLYDADSRGVVPEASLVTVLSDCTQATVRRVINGEISLTASFPPGARSSEALTIGRAIRAAVNEAGKLQDFIIKRRTRTFGGMTVYAEHQSYYYNGCILRGGGSGESVTPSFSFSQIRQSAHPDIRDIGQFTFSRASNTARIAPAITSPTALRNVLLHWLIETYGGELIFDGFDVEWVDAMGADRGAVYQYGKNITDMTAEDIPDGYASGIFPFWGSVSPQSNVGIVTIQEWTLNYPGTYPVEVIVPVDLTKRFETQPTQEQLLTAAREYLSQNSKNGMPISIKASRARIQGDVPVDLGDTVTVVNSPWGINTKTRIMAMTFDALRRRVIDVEFGTVNPGLAGSIINLVKE